MNTFLAVTTKGLTEVLTDELKELGIQVTGSSDSGVFFEGPWLDAYKVNLHSRIANRVTLPLAEFRCENQDELYDRIFELDFSPYLKAKGSFLVDATVRDCGELKDQRYVAMKVKDAICDSYREKHGGRPDVEKDEPDVRLIVRGYKRQFSVSVDTTGAPLFQRGYRREGGMAPLKETLAAALIRLTGWDKKSPFVDLMCGSGTIPIEAAMMACNMAPGTFRRRFSFENFEGFVDKDFDDLREAAYDAETDLDEVFIHGVDRNFRMVKAAKKNSKKAGISNLIEFHKAHIMALPQLPEGAMVFINPPYGERMGDEFELIDTYRDIGFMLKSKFAGSEAWLLSSSKKLVGEVKMKSFKNHEVMNGPLVCRYLGYKINQR